MIRDDDPDDDVVDGSEGLHDGAGHEITREYLERAAREAEAGYDIDPVRMVGRPSLTGERGHSPRVSFRITGELRERAEHEARRQGTTVSQLAREALERYLAS